jgi:uroporphyrin-III C-methyltransferase/precorrin-2 dehydrogenase/sirohydrochlorin ferrochelatase
MGVAHFGAIADELIANGHAPTTPVAIIENGTRDDQRVIRASLVDLARVSTDHAIKSPALLLVGETVRCAERYRWFDRGALVVAPEPDTAKGAQAANL